MNAWFYNHSTKLIYQLNELVDFFPKKIFSNERLIALIVIILGQCLNHCLTSLVNKIYRMCYYQKKLF